MGVAVRVIPCLDVDAGRVVKGVNFADLRDAGDPVEMARVYDAEGADELTFLDVTASSGERATMLDVVRRTAEQVFIPLTVGRRHPQRRRRRRAAARRRGQGQHQHRRHRPPGAAARGQPPVRVAVHRAVGRRPHRARRASAPTPSGWEVTTHGGRRGTGIDAVEWAARGQELGVGEILLNSMDADGTRAGFDLRMIAAVRAAVDVPVIASRRRGRGGALRARGARAGADAVLAATRLPLRTLPDREVKASLRAAEVEVR